jgi:hypothetical protein
MILGNMRANGVWSLAVSRWQCHREAVLSADPGSAGRAAFGCAMLGGSQTFWFHHTKV